MIVYGRYELAGVRHCPGCDAHVPIVVGAIRCEDCGGPPVPVAELRRIASADLARAMRRVTFSATAPRRAS